MAEERENQKPGRSDEDFELHSQKPGLLDDADPDQAKSKLANDEDDDVEGHTQKPHQVGG